MFRQVVAYRWAEKATTAEKATFTRALAGLREIEELTALTLGDDVGRFPGNHDFVAVLDFPDFAAARRYVADPRHQAFVRDAVPPVVGERVVVQHDWALGDLVGIHHVKLPVSDLARSRDWYVRALGLEVQHEFFDGGRLAGVALVHPSSPVCLALREDRARAAALAGFDAVALTLSTPADLDVYLRRLEDLDVVHGERVMSPVSEVVDVPDPDGIVVRLYALRPGQPLLDEAPPLGREHARGEQPADRAEQVALPADALTRHEA